MKRRGRAAKAKPIRCPHCRGRGYIPDQKVVRDGKVFEAAIVCRCRAPSFPPPAPVLDFQRKASGEKDD